MPTEYLYDHYKDSCERQTTALRDRNRFFLATLVLTFLLGVFAYNPQDGVDLAKSMLAKYGLDVSISGQTLQSFLWCSVLYVYIRYLQLMTTIERGYLYLNKLEEDLKKNGVLIEREGANYSRDWPLLSRVIDWLYKVFFIVLFEFVLIYKVTQEGFPGDVFTIIDWSVLVAFSILTVLYWCHLDKIDAAYDERNNSKTV